MSRNLLLIASVLLLSGCGGWDVIDHHSRSDIDAAHLEGKHVRVSSSLGTEDLRVTRVVFPFIDGITREGKEERTVNLRRVDRLEMRTAHLEGVLAQAFGGIFFSGLLTGFSVF